MAEKSEIFTIGALASAAGVGIETIRFYQRKELLPQPERPHGGIRRYGERDIARVKFIKTAQRLGFSLDEVAELLRLEDGTHCNEARVLAEHELDDVRKKIAELQRIESALSRLIDDCGTRQGSVMCPLITALQLTMGLPSTNDQR